MGGAKVIPDLTSNGWEQYDAASLGLEQGAYFSYRIVAVPAGEGSELTYGDPRPAVVVEATVVAVVAGGWVVVTGAAVVVGATVVVVEVVLVVVVGDGLTTAEVVDIGLIPVEFQAATRNSWSRAGSRSVTV